MRYGIERHTFWALRYRKPQDILASIYLRLKSAYEAECGRQERLLRHEIELNRAMNDAVDTPAVRAAAALVGAQEK